MMRLSILIGFCFLVLTINAQNPIPEGITKKVFFDEFMDKSEKWPVETTKVDIYTNYKDGDYLISRKSPDKSYAVQANFDEISRNFIIKSAIEMAPTSGKNGSIGIFVMFQQGLSGGLIYEFNNYGKYRIRQVSANGFKVISSNPDKKGWTRSPYIKTENKLEIKAYAGVYEFYSNGKLVDRLVNTDFKKGSFGIWVGPQTLAKVQYYYTYHLNIPSQPDIVKDDFMVQMENLKAENGSLKDQLRTLSVADGADRPGAVEAIKILEKRITQLRSENEAMSAQLEKVTADSDAGAVDLIEKMTEELAVANHRNDSLRRINQDLLTKFDLVQEELFNAKETLKNSSIAENDTLIAMKEEVEEDKVEEEAAEENTTETAETIDTEMVTDVEEQENVPSKIVKRKFKVEKAVLKIN